MSHPMTRVLLAMAWACVASGTLAVAGPLQDDLASRRARLIEQLGPDGVAIVWSAPSKVYSLDVDYEFRQDSHLLYLTGITQEDTTLVLVPGAKTVREVLFVRQPDRRREHRNGHLLTKEEVTAQSGVKTVYFVNEFEPFVTALFNRQVYGLKRNEVSAEFDAFFDAVTAGRARLALPFGPRRPRR